MTWFCCTCSNYNGPCLLTCSFSICCMGQGVSHISHFAQMQVYFVFSQLLGVCGWWLQEAFFHLPMMLLLEYKFNYKVFPHSYSINCSGCSWWSPQGLLHVLRILESILRTCARLNGFCSFSDSAWFIDRSMVAYTVCLHYTPSWYNKEGCIPTWFSNRSDFG